MSEPTHQPRRRAVEPAMWPIAATQGASQDRGRSSSIKILDLPSTGMSIEQDREPLAALRFPDRGQVEQAGMRPPKSTGRRSEAGAVADSGSRAPRSGCGPWCLAATVASGQEL